MKALIIAVNEKEYMEDLCPFPFGDSFPPLPDYQAYLISSLLKQGHVEHSVFDVRDTKCSEPVLASITQMSFNYDVLYLHSRWDNIQLQKKIITAVKEHQSPIKIIMGGLIASFYDELILKAFPIDCCIRGEVEKNLVELLKWMRKQKGFSEKISGLSFLKESVLCRNKPSSLMTETSLEHLPYPAYELLPAGVYPTISLETSRGYPYYDPLQPDFYNRTWRGVSPMEIFERLRKSIEFCSEFEGRVFLRDEYFTPKEKRIYDLNQIIARRKKDPSAQIVFNARCSDIIEKSFAKQLVPSAAGIILKPHCGYNKGLRMLKKGYDTTIIERSANLLQECGLSQKAVYCFTKNHLWESAEDIDKTNKFAAFLREEYGVNTIVKSFYPKAGTLLFDQLFQEGKASLI